MSQNESLYPAVSITFNKFSHSETEVIRKNKNSILQIDSSIMQEKSRDTSSPSYYCQTFNSPSAKDIQKIFVNSK